MKKTRDLKQIIADIAAEVYKLRFWREGENYSESGPEAWFDSIIEDLNEAK